MSAASTPALPPAATERAALDDIRSANRALILDLAASAGTTTCPALAQQSGLSRATVYIIADELVRAGVLARHGAGKSSGGRRPELLRFEPRAWAAIGVELAEREVRALVADLRGTPVARDVEPLPGRTPAAVAGAIATLVGRLERRVPNRRALGLGVAVPGIVDQAAGVVRLSVLHEWTDVPLAAMLSARTGRRTYLASRSMAAALGEYRSGAGRGARHLVYIYAGQGLGAGIVLDGALYTGAGAGAGELGHVTVEPDGALCTCGNRGCLHTVASGAALVARAQARLRERPETGAILRRLGGPDQSLLRTIDLAQAAAAGDAIAAPLVAEAGRYVGLAAATVLNLVNPDRIILGGPLTAAGSVFLDAVYEEARRRALAVPLAAVQFATSALRADAAAVGAAGLVLQHAGDLVMAGSV
jgi:predicted NBD/HSP70 family sugar kinase